MPDASLQKAVVAALSASGSLPGDVYGDAPQLDPAASPGAFPYVEVWDFDTRDAGTRDGDLWDILVRVHAFSLDGGGGELVAMQRAIWAALHRSPLVLPDGFRLLMLRFEKSRRDRNPDDVRHGVSEFRALVEPSLG